MLTGLPEVVLSVGMHKTQFPFALDKKEGMATI